MILDREPEDGRKDHWDDQPAAEHLHATASGVTTEEREARFGQKPGDAAPHRAHRLRQIDASPASWNGSSSTWACAVAVLDGQTMRLGISRDLGFSADEREAKTSAAAWRWQTFNDAGILCIGAFVAPDEAVRQKAADRVGRDRFLVVHLRADRRLPQRDTDGHYPLADTPARSRTSPACRLLRAAGESGSRAVRPMNGRSAAASMPVVSLLESRGVQIESCRQDRHPLPCRIGPAAVITPTKAAPAIASISPRCVRLALGAAGA